MENQNSTDSFYTLASPDYPAAEKRESSTLIRWETDFFQITPEGMELVQKTGAESLTL